MATCQSRNQSVCDTPPPPLCCGHFIAPVLPGNAPPKLHDVTLLFGKPSEINVGLVLVGPFPPRRVSLLVSNAHSE
jgi:hypothetical protein